MPNISNVGPGNVRPSYQNKPNTNNNNGPAYELEDQNGLNFKESCAIRVENAYKRHSSKMPFVLNGLHMSVQKSSIYSLLGASGCGKTTLLSCITGQNVLNSGLIHLTILKKKQLGFMPQQVSLYSEFTIHEMINYYGLIYGMTLSQIDERAKYLQELLHLSHFNRLCGSLSGGQQRRVSLAVTLLHDPELLILDEPTSGIDPVIADEIWTHLLSLTERGTTILITTHYIEEARRSDMIGLMRNGVLLEEASPKSLLDKYNLTSLEEVFLLLSTYQQHERLEQKRRSAQLNWTSKLLAKKENITKKKTDLTKSTRSLQSKEYFKWSRIKAQLWKHLLWMKGNLGVMSFMAFVPMFCILFFNWAVGHIPQQLPLGVINQEANLSYCDGRNLNRINCTSPDQFGCIFLDKLKEESIKLIEFTNEETARMAARRNIVWGFLTIPENFTSGVEQRLSNAMNMDSVDVDLTEMRVELDRTDFIISNGIMAKLRHAFKEMGLMYSATCNHSEHLVNLPPVREHYLFGTVDTTYTQFTGPAILILVIFYMPYLFTTSALIMEKSKGIIERSMVAGMTTLEIITAHFIVQVILLLFQVIFCLVMQYKVFDHPWNGSFALVFSLLVMLGLVGSLCGLITAFLFRSDGAAGLTVIGTTIPLLFLSGFLWPVEGIETYTRYLANFLPLTLPIESFRSIVFRGFNIYHWKVYYGFLSCSGWIVTMTFLSWVLLRYKNGLV